MTLLSCPAIFAAGENNDANATLVGRTRQRRHRNRRRRQRPRRRRPTTSKRRRRLADDAFGSVLRPKVTRIGGEEDGGPSTGRKVVGSLSMANGSPWCQGRPTYWVTGHHWPDHPWCYDAPSGRWRNDSGVVLDYSDYRNSREDVKMRDEDELIDRHDCLRVDANKDGIPDIVCIVGTVTNKLHLYTAV